MDNTQKQWTDDRLIAEAESGLRGQGALVEAMRRLRIALEESNAKNVIYSRRMWWLTVAIALLTFVQAIVAIPIIMSWFG